MTDFRTVTDKFAVSPQISASEVADAAAQGFTLIINNRPDGESPGQPLSAEIEAAALSAGLTFVHIPIAGRPTADQAEAVRRAAEAADGKALAFCRSGTRSITAWALGQAASKAIARDELVRLGAAAGYDLSAIPAA